MRSITLALAVVAASVAGYASGAVLLNETFTYPNGDLVPNGGWVQLSSGGTVNIQVVSNRAQGSGGNPDDQKMFAAQANNVKTYAAFRVKILDPVTSSPRAVYFALLTDGTASSFVSRLFVLPITDGTRGWTFGITHGTPGAATPVAAWSSVLAATLTYGTDYTVVVNYDPVAKTSKLWVDPVNEASSNVTVTDAAIAAIAVSSIGLRQSASSSSLPPAGYPLQAAPGTGDFVWSVDGLSVGTTFADAIAGVDPCNTDVVLPTVTPPASVTVTQTLCS